MYIFIIVVTIFVIALVVAYIMRELLTFLVHSFTTATEESIYSARHKTEWRDDIQKWILEKDQNAGKWAIVTGGTSGIGREATIILARAGFNVIVTGRGKPAGESTVRAALEASKRSHGVEFESVDISNLEAVRDFGYKLLERKLRIAVVLCNAGVMGAFLGLSNQGYETHVATNHLGHYLLLHILEPSLSAVGGSVVLVSSCTHKWSHGYREEQLRPYKSVRDAEPHRRWDCYADTKLMNLMTAIELDKQWNAEHRFLTSCERSPININAVHPGCIRSGISGNLHKVLQLLLKLVDRIVLKHPEEGAAAVLAPLLDSKYKGHALSGRYFHMYYLQPSESARIHRDALDEQKRQRLIELSNEAIQPFLRR